LEQVRGGVCYLKMDAFLDLAQNAGMPRERALSFVKHATFQENSRDLFDTPLIQTADGRHIIFSSLFTQCALHEAVTSRINSLLLQVDRKGPGFEREARESFAQLGGIPKRIEYRNKEGKFECDAAVLWNNALLLVECKAYTLPQTSASDLFLFRLRQEEAADQIRRIARHIAEDPSIIERAFGRNLDGLHVTLCVLNLAPFSAPGENRDVKFYDHGALSKFCEGAIKAVIRGPKQRTEDPIAETVLGRLWVGAVPTPDDLLRQMDQPFQYLNESGKWDVEEFLVALSNDLMMLSPFLRRRPDRLTDLPELRKSIAGRR
jgi:hypothetical protein